MSVVTDARDYCVTAVTGGALIGSNVYKGDPHSKEALPHCRVNIGPLAIEHRSAGATMQGELDLVITVAAESTTDLDGAVWAVFEEAYEAIGADATLGGAAINSLFVEVGEPERSGEAKKPTAILRAILRAQLNFTQSAI